MRWVPLIVLLIGCGAHRDAGPAWPKPSAPAADGGESLAPHQASSVAAVETSSEDKPSDAPAPAAKPTTTAPPAVGGGSAAPPPLATPTKTDDPMTTEEIVIEIDGD